MNKKPIILAVIAVMTPTIATAQHADVSPRVDNGKIVTDAFEDGGGGTPTPNVRVFAYDFQEDPLDPFFAADPGFNAVDGSGLPAASQLGFNVLAPGAFGLPANLSYWNGVGAVTWSSVPSSESLRLNLGAQNRQVGNGTSDIAGFAIGTVDADGGLHKHLNSFLQGSDGNSDPSDGFPPADGIYLVAMNLTSSDSGIAASLPFFLVFNNGLDEGVHDQSIDFVQSTLVPEPASAALLLGSATLGLMFARERRRA